MSKRKSANANVESVENLVMLEKIQEGLPKGFTTTNKKAVQKKIGKIGSIMEETLWTSWAQSSTTKGLAVLKSDGEVKFIPENEYSKYIINGKTMAVK